MTMSKHKKKRAWHPLSIEHKKKIGLKLKGHIVTEETRQKISLKEKGKIVSSKTKEKLRKTFFKEGSVPWNKGTKGFMSGAKNPMWRGGITGWQKQIRNSIEYRLWREAVFKRDNYQCIWGGKDHGTKLHADHIKPFAYFPELRFAIDNGRTLCIDCHRKTDTFGKRSILSVKLLDDNKE